MNLQPARLFQQFARSTPLLITAALFAQAPVSPNHVAFYTEPNFRGEVLIVEAGAAVPNLDSMRRSNQAPWMFAISSVKVEGTARATLHSGPNFSGHRIDLTTSVTDLYALQLGNERGATWDRAIASVAVTGAQPVIVTQPAPPPKTVVVVQSPPPRPTHVVVAPPPPPPRPRYDRHAAELVVQRAFREVLGRPADPEGLRTYRERLMHEGWSEQQMIEQLQRSSEARGINADVAINKAYREVLGRDADPSGLAHYRSKWKDGWTQGQIRDDLRRSHEGRDAKIREAVTRAYRELLGREADAAGLANYERLMREKGYSERDIRQAIMSGDEYKQRTPITPKGRGK